MSSRSIQLYINDIKESIEKIELFTRGMTFEVFKQDARTIDAVVRNMEVIGEAAKNFPEDVRMSFPNVPWKMMIGMRNKAIHEYFGIDVEILWKTVEQDIPVLKKEIQNIPSHSST